MESHVVLAGWPFLSCLPPPASARPWGLLRCEHDTGGSISQTRQVQAPRGPAPAGKHGAGEDEGTAGELRQGLQAHASVLARVVEVRGWPESNPFHQPGFHPSPSILEFVSLRAEMERTPVFLLGPLRELNGTVSVTLSAGAGPMTPVPHCE